MKILIQPFAKQLHNGNENAKNYPYWKELISELKNLNHEIIQIGINGEEQLVDDFRLNLPFSEVEALLCECDLWIGIDSFLQHLAWYNNKRGIVIFSKSDPLIFGHKENINLLKDRKYLRHNQFDVWESEPIDLNSFIDVQTVLNVISSEFNTSSDGSRVM